MFFLQQRLFLDDYDPWQRRRFMAAGLTRDERQDSQEDGIVAHHCMEIRPAGVDESRNDIPSQVPLFQNT
jgi:hypothetical protein